MAFVEFELNDTKLRVFETGEIWKFGCKKWTSKQETWFQLFGSTKTHKDGYKSHKTEINRKKYTTSRIIYKAFNLEWDISITKDNTIDHISRNSLDNNLSNLRVATIKEQALNRDFVINAKGYHLKNGKYEATICVNGKIIYLGTYPTEAEAHNAYQNAVIKYRN
jgi:hypothetical protein